MDKIYCSILNDLASLPNNPAKFSEILEASGWTLSYYPSIRQRSKNPYILSKYIENVLCEVAFNTYGDIEFVNVAGNSECFWTWIQNKLLKVLVVDCAVIQELVPQVLNSLILSYLFTHAQQYPVQTLPGYLSASRQMMCKTVLPESKTTGVLEFLQEHTEKPAQDSTQES